MRFKLPWPCSVNALYRTVNRRVIISEEGRAWKRAAHAALWTGRMQGVQWPLQGRLQVVIEAWSPNRRSRDLDNLAKVVLDAGNKILWIDDAQIDDLRIVRMAVDPEKVGYVWVDVSLIGD